jgi:aspartate aminotransferase
MYEFERRNSFFQQHYETKDLAIMGRNTNYFPNDPRIKAALLGAIEREVYHDYAPPCGLKELQGLILEELGVPDLYAWVVDGATEGLYQVMRFLLAPGEEFVTSDPGYNITNNFAAHSGAKVVEVPVYDPECGYRLSPARLRDHLSDRTRIIYLVDPLNPLGSCLTETELREICSLARERGAIVVQDGTYRDFADAQIPAVRIAPENAVMLYSFSKSAGFAGLRLGAVVAHPSIIDRLTRAQVNNLGSSLVAQLAGIVALRTKREWLPGILAKHREHMAILHTFIRSLPGFSVPVYPSQCNFLAVDSSVSGFHPEYLAVELMKRKVQVRQGGYNTRRFGDRFFRVGTTVPREWVDRFCDALTSIVQAGAPRDFHPQQGLY